MNLLHNELFWSVILAVLLPQAFKTIKCLYEKGKITVRDMFKTGSMPSSHSSVVTALTVCILLTEGFNTNLFIAAVFSGIVIRDAVGVRRTVGEESKVLTKVVTMLKKKYNLKISRKMHHSLGHQPIEVVVGIIVGAAIAIGVHAFFYF